MYIIFFSQKYDFKHLFSLKLCSKNLYIYLRSEKIQSMMLIFFPQGIQYTHTVFTSKYSF